MPAKILVIEDNPDTREVLELLLTNNGFDVITVGDGPQGLDVSQAERPDLIIADLNLPGLAGFRLLEALGADPELQDIPVIVYAAVGQKRLDQAIFVEANRAVARPASFERIEQDARDLFHRQLNV